jgi:hypothetical protein
MQGLSINQMHSHETQLINLQMHLTAHIVLHQALSSVGEDSFDATIRKLNNKKVGSRR